MIDQNGSNLDIESARRRVTLPQVEAELQRLAPLARSKKRKGAYGDLKTILAVLVAEMHQFDKVAGRGTFIRRLRELGFTDATANKYQQAGRALLDTDPAAYARVLLVVQGGGDAGALPRVSKLAALPTVRKQGAVDESPERFLESKMPLRLALSFRSQVSFGEADDEGRRTLTFLDDAARISTQLAELLHAVGAGRAGHTPENLLRIRLERLRQVLVGVVEELSGLVDP